MDVYQYTHSLSLGLVMVLIMILYTDNISVLCSQLTTLVHNGLAALGAVSSFLTAHQHIKGAVIATAELSSDIWLCVMVIWWCSLMHTVVNKYHWWRCLELRKSRVIRVRNECEWVVSWRHISTWKQMNNDQSTWHWADQGVKYSTSRRFDV